MTPTAQTPALSSERIDPIPAIVIAMFVAVLAYLAYGCWQDFRLEHERAISEMTRGELFQLSGIVEVYHDDWKHYPVAQDAPITHQLLDAWAIPDNWTPPRAPMAPNEPFRLTVTGSGAKATYTIVAPGLFHPGALANLSTAQGKPCAQTCTRLSWTRGKAIGI